MHEFEQLEDAVIAKLESLKATGLRTLETYSGQIEVDDLDDIIMDYPCIYVMASGLDNNVINKLDKCSMDLTLVVGDSNVRGNTSAARGDVASPGVYELLSGARQALHMERIMDGWARLLLMREEPLVYMPESGVCFYGANYRIKALKTL